MLNGVKWDNKSHNQGNTEPCGVNVLSEPIDDFCLALLSGILSEAN